VAGLGVLVSGSRDGAAVDVACIGISVGVGGSVVVCSGRFVGVGASTVGGTVGAAVCEASAAGSWDNILSVGDGTSTVGAADCERSQALNIKRIIPNENAIYTANFFIISSSNGHHFYYIFISNFINRWR
jgi:hypothetical protein